MSGIALSEIKTPYAVSYKVGETYRWPAILHYTSLTSYLEATYYGGENWYGVTYRGEPLPFKPCEVMLSMMMSHPSERRVRKETVARFKTPPDELVGEDGFLWNIVGGDITQYKTVGPKYKKGAKLILERWVQNK